MSWVIVNRKTGEAVMETFNRKYTKNINQELFEVLPIGDWLARVNAKIKKELRA